MKYCNQDNEEIKKLLESDTYGTVANACLVKHVVREKTHPGF
jgi:hypothetical protein